MKWWQNSVVYQIYPRSFKDSNHDGIGDLQGVISKLDYLKYLGVDVLWLCPVYASPNDDNGYDISDYYAIQPDFGTMADMEELIAKAKDLGIRIIMDLVANHTSDQHEWFQKAIRDKNSPYHDYYVFREDTGGTPSDLQSIFLGSAWEKNEIAQEYYLHMFAKSQPDLNWDNPSVRQDMHQMINWWLDKGIGGFRLDVIDMISKDIDKKMISDGKNLHPYIQEMSKETFSKYDVLTVGETWGATVEKARKYSNLDGTEFSMIFNFSHILLDQQEGKEKWDYKKLDLLDLKRIFSQQQIGLYQTGWNSLFWNNHDLPRIVSRWGDDKKYRRESATMLATLLHMLQGTPFIYQGEELGMTNVRFDSLADYRDIEIFNMVDARRKRGISESSIMDSIYKIGRDNARTPMQWNHDAYAGFSDVEPWINVNSNYLDINVDDQLNDGLSILQYYRKLIQFRRDSEWMNLIRDGAFELILEGDSNVFGYRRFDDKLEMVILCNFTSENINLEFDLSSYQRIISNYFDLNTKVGVYLRPYEAMVVGKEVHTDSSKVIKQNNAQKRDK